MSEPLADRLRFIAGYLDRVGATAEEIVMAVTVCEAIAALKATPSETNAEPTPDMIRQGVWAWQRHVRESTADDVRAIYMAMRRMEGRMQIALLE
jgi:hypothetical protein